MELVQTVLLAQADAISRCPDGAFLRDRCALLTGALEGRTTAADLIDEVLEGAVLRRWTRLLLPDVSWPVGTQLALEELYVLQARIVERVARGGVGDLSPAVERIARAIWVDRLHRATDHAVDLLR